MSELESLHNSETTDTSYDHVLKYTGIFGGVQVLKMLLSIARNKLTSIYLGGVGVGLISIYNSISEFLVSASNLGVPLNATRQTSELFEEGTNTQIEHFVMVVRTWVLWTALLATLFCLLCSPLISYFFFEHDWSHFPQVILTAPIAVSFLVAEGECAILKGLRQLRRVAIIESLLAVTTLLLTVPFYYFLGMKGVIFGLIASGAMSVVVHFNFSLRLVSYKVKPFSLNVFREGLPMMKVGIPYVLAGVANSGLGLAIPAILLVNNSMADVGYYKVGWQLAVGYAAMAFVALESDFFPRLSSVNHDIKRMNLAINQQIEVCTLIVTPPLILMALFMPFLIQLLHTPEFLVVTDMALCAIFYTFFHAVSLPLGYCTLAKGDSILFLFLEICYDIIFGVLLFLLYSYYGLAGAGIALSLGSLYDVVIYQTVCGWKYRCFVSRHTWALFGIQFVLLSFTLLTCVISPDEYKYYIGIAIFLMSLSFSVSSLMKRSDIMRRFTHRFK